jgi:hypothetical protein
MKILIYDIETLKEMFLIGIYVPHIDEYFEFEVSLNTNQLDAFMKFVGEYDDYYWVGYNNLRFDSQVVEWVIRNNQYWHELPALEITGKICQKAQDVIHDANYDVFPEYRETELSLKQLDLFKIHHFDNKNRMVSLKRLEFEMDFVNIEEMPIHFLKENMTATDRYLTRGYCKIDVMATYEFYKITIGDTNLSLYRGNDQIQLRLDIKEEFGIDCLNYSDSKIGDEMIKKYYCQEKRIHYNELPRKGFFRKSIDVRNCIAKYVEFETDQLNKFLLRMKKVKLGLKDDFKETIDFYGTKYSFMKGGLHSENKPEIFEEDDDYLIIDWDVASYYPAIIINNRKFPFHLGVEFLRGYEQMFNKRLELKPQAKKDRKIRGIVGALKLAVNSVYGKSSDMNSWIYDRQLTMFTTITGELSLMMLIEKYELAGIKVISANTDGVTIRIHKDLLDKMFEINEEWCTTTGYILERTDYKKIIFSSVNDYLAIKTDGEIKKKGDFLTDFELYKNKSMRIVSLALEQYYVNDIPVEDTIKNHKNIYDFAIRQKATRNFHYEGIITRVKELTQEELQSLFDKKIKTEGWKKQPWWDNKMYWVIPDMKINDHFGGYTDDELLSIIKNEHKYQNSKKNVYNKLIRYYVSNSGEKLYKIKNEDCDTNAAPRSQVEAGEWLCTVCNHLESTDATTLDINYDYYIMKANRIIRKVLGVKKEIIIDPAQLGLNF